ncbi:MAG TPA: hypothetical protein VEK08_17285 [Planctomycetota bacterium]|nr:hypothetical protein [Planctomycetota bacterium]
MPLGRTALILSCVLALLASVMPEAKAALVNRSQRGTNAWATESIYSANDSPLVSEGGGIWRKTIPLQYAVDATKAYVDGSFRMSTESPQNRCTFELTNTSIICRSYQGTNVVTLEWEVVEFTDATVRRGTQNFNNNQVQLTSINIGASVPLNKSFVIISERTASATFNTDESWTIRASFLPLPPVAGGSNPANVTQLQFDRGGGVGVVTVAWQVVTFVDTVTSVYRNFVSIAANATTATATFGNNGTASATIDLTRSFLLSTRRSNTNAGGKESYYMCGGSFASATQVRFTREEAKASPATPLDISFFVIQLGTDALVETGTMNMPSGTGTSNVTIGAVALDKTFCIVSIYGGGADNHYLDKDSVTSTLSTNTNIRFQRNGTPDSVINGVWFVIQYQVLSAYRETCDLDGDGQIDAIRFLAYEPINDNFSGLNITVAGYTVTGYSSTSSPGGPNNFDNEFYAFIAQSGVPDTGLTPNVRFVANTSLRGTASNILLRTESVGQPPVDKARPALVTSLWSDASGGGVSATDTIVLTFSESVIVPAAIFAPALISQTGPVTGDNYGSMSSIGQMLVGSTTVLMTLNVDALAGEEITLSPGGTYSSGAITAGSPSGMYIIQSGADPLGNSLVQDLLGNFSATGSVTRAIDLGPSTVVIAAAWDDGSLSIGAKLWNIGTSELNVAHQAYAAFPPTGLIVRNTGNVRSKLTANCSVSTPAGWSVAAVPGPDQFTMEVSVVGPPYVTYPFNLATPQDILLQRYSGRSSPFDLQFTTPASITAGAGVSQDIIVTITISQD